VIREALRRVGVDVVAYAPRNYLHLRRPLLLRELAVGLVLDAGAGDGGWAARLRAGGYSGRILSFEPQEASFADLERRAAHDALWECRRVALADMPGEADLHVAANGQSSSLLPMVERHRVLEPGSAYVASERVETARLDDLVDDAGDAVFLKADVQGYELPLLRGAERVLERACLVEVELSATPLYEGQALLPEVLQFVVDRGFELIGLETSFRDRRTGDLLQANGMLRRR
jgi:FkbM family methyltransferase